MIKPDFSRFVRVLQAVAFEQPWTKQRDPLMFRSPPLPMPAEITEMPHLVASATPMTHMRITVQLWDDGGHRVSHEYGDGAGRWRSDSLPTKFATVGEMLAAIMFQPEHRRRLFAGTDDGQGYPDIKAIMAGKPTPADLGFVESASTPVTAMRRSIHRSHRGEGHNFVD